MRSNEKVIKELYLEHNESLVFYTEKYINFRPSHKHFERIVQKVPEKDLLVWNVKDGWEPLCKACFA